MVTPAHGPPPDGWLEPQVPFPIVDNFNVVAWPRRPLTVTTSMSGQTVTFNEPPPVGVDHEALAAFLAHLGAREGAQDIVYAARQYKAALELIEQRPATAYLALVSVVETLAAIRHPACRRREARSGCRMERENLLPDAKGQAASGSNREGESTDAGAGTEQPVVVSKAL